MSTAFYSHPECRLHDMGAGHPECPQRLDAIADQLLASGLDIALQHREAPLATLAQIGVSPVSMGGHYRLALDSEADDRYEVLASATGAQAGDTACRHMLLRVVGANVVQASGPDSTATNPAATNRKCWNQ